MNANALTQLASKKAILNKSIETFCSLASSSREERVRQELKAAVRNGVQGLFAPTVLAAPGENSPRK